MLGSVSRILPRPIRIFHPPLKEATSCSPSSTVKPIMFMIRSAREDSVVTPFLSAAACSFVMRSNTCRDNMCVCVCVCARARVCAIQGHRAQGFCSTSSSQSKIGG